MPLPSSSSPASFPCLMVRRAPQAGRSNEATCAVESIGVDDLPPGDVRIAVEWSSLNYKDALAFHAHPGVVHKLPHVPGIDCAGTVLQSDCDQFAVGQSVLVTGYHLGSARWGGWSGQVRVPAEWVVPMPKGLSAETAMLFGTAGFTAAQSVDRLQQHGVMPDAGEVVVTGATGGVGSLSVAILAKLGYRVTAVTGKSDRYDLLETLGAATVLSRDQVNDTSDRPLLRDRWAGAIDTVGGNTLATLLRQTRHRGCVTACGLVGGDQLPLTVFPFILRGVTLSGIDSAQCPRQPRMRIWQHLANDWKPDGLQRLAHKVSLSEVSDQVRAMMNGQSWGRILVKPVV